MITEKERQVIAEQKRGFNVIKENDDYNYMSSRRSEHSRFFAGFLLKLSVYFNITSLFLIVITLFVYIKKPNPEIYVSTPLGKVYKLERLTK